MGFSEKELGAIEVFEKEHLNCHKNNNINGCDRIGFTIHSYWTSIGVASNITCDCCGKTQDITDYDCW